MKAPSGINCGKLVDEGDLCLLGCTDGNVVAVDLSETGSTKPLYGYGADPQGGAINCLGLTPDGNSLLAGGDSGTVLKIFHS